MKIRKAVIPAAGLGTRFLPVTKSVPKELLPILDKPMLQYVVEEAAEAGIEQVIIVTSVGKESIASYFQPQPDLVRHLADSGADELLEKVVHATGLAEVSFVIQEKPIGLGHAVLTAREVVAGEPFVVILPDDIITHKPRSGNPNGGRGPKGWRRRHSGRTHALGPGSKLRSGGCQPSRGEGCTRSAAWWKNRPRRKLLLT